MMKIINMKTNRHFRKDNKTQAKSKVYPTNHECM